MGQYSGARTAHALTAIKEDITRHALDGTLIATQAEVAAFVGGAQSSPLLAFCAAVAEAHAHRDCINIEDLSAIDWDFWRLATELRLLEWRIRAKTLQSSSRLSWPEASTLLHLAISLLLTQRKSVAEPVFTYLAAEIGPVLAGMERRKDKVRDWGAIAALFQDMVPANALPAQLRCTPPLTLADAAHARPSYSDGRDPAGALLQGQASDLVPVELIWFANRIGAADPDLAQMQASIAATGYPENAVFQEMDVLLTIEDY